METFLNLLWLAIAAAATLTVPRRSKRIWFALGCTLALLFPIVSVSDDLLAGRDVLEEALAVMVTAVILSICLVTVALVTSPRPRPVPLLFATPSDPRSPPSIGA